MMGFIIGIYVTNWEMDLPCTEDRLMESVLAAWANRLVNKLRLAW